MQVGANRDSSEGSVVVVDVLVATGSIVRQLLLQVLSGESGILVSGLEDAVGPVCVTALEVELDNSCIRLNHHSSGSRIDSSWGLFF